MVAIVLWTRVCVGVWVFRMVAVGGVVWGLFVPLVVLVWVGVVAPVWVCARRLSHEVGAT